jgi:NAD(P)-dependent dehydrogenase (short-subunit alcohol dehydrogenase family)
MSEMLELARWLADLGRPDALLILVGSAFARPGRHGFRTPLYSLSKSMIPTLAQILALELAVKGKRCAAVIFDVIDSGMNKAMSPAQRQMQSDRVPAGRLPDAEDAARQILWMFENGSFLMSGATLTLTGGALP